MKRVRLPRVAKGYRRRFVRCKRCRRVYYYDFIPYSLSSPMMVTNCGHSIGARDYGLKDITEADFRAAVAKERAP